MSTFKITAIFIVVLAGLIGGAYPLLSKHQQMDSRSFSLSLAFTAGIFLAVGLIHMLPEANQLFAEIDPTLTFPLATLIAMGMFFLLLFLEHLATGLHQHNRSHDFTTPTIIVFILAIMLSIHSLFMGVSLGIATNKATILVIFIAIIAHKTLASFALATQLHFSALNKKSAIITFAFFVLMTPLGILLGDDLQHTLSGNHILFYTAIFFSLSAGTFLYMGTLHGLERSPLIKLCCNMKEFTVMLSGFVMMTLVHLYT